MSNRRLVSRSRMNDAASPAPPRRQQPRASETPVRQTQTQTELPPYEPPVCALSEDAQHALESLGNTYDYRKYSKHLDNAKVVIRNAAAESNDRLLQRKENFPKQVERRRREGVADEDRSEGEAKDETVLKGFERANDKFTLEAEEAMRELIDYSDELSVQDAIMKEVAQEIASAPAPRRAPPRRRRNAGSDDEGQEAEDNEPPAADPDNMSAVELLRQAKEDRAAQYASQSKRARYADNNDYKIFKQILHHAQNPDSGQNPPHPSTWFPEENKDGPGPRRRRNNTTDNTNNGGDSDSEDEVIIASASESLTCPLTLQYFKDPVTNTQCKHTIDRAALADYHRTEARVFQGTNDNKKVAKCPTTGCDTMLAMEDYVKDELMARKVERAIRREKEQDNEDDEADDDLPRGTQRSRPEQIDDDGDDDIVDDVNQARQAKAARIKRERARSRGGLSMAPSQPAATMDSDEDSR
ncbi:related to DNA repair protein MMS21 [Rhynchosporium secalis]|uniref:Related to DNA repair protein MMS21 n=1 Tax=Rhynchosporium secalis TaxID=38038 RepID=A0A1E1M9T1_RHYSE|nr:related to DNA repair protein MMS21 [Rhynchosporium secalis]